MEVTKYNGNVLKVTEEEIGKVNYERAYFKHEGIVILPINPEGKIIVIKEKRLESSSPIWWKLNSTP